MAPKPELNLNQAFSLPHVATGVIHSAQQAIGELEWHDDFDDFDDFDGADHLDDDDDDLDAADALSTPAYSLLSRPGSRGSNSFTGLRTGGLSPPGSRRLRTFANFDGYHHPMAEGTQDGETGDFKRPNNANGQSQRTSVSAHDIDMTELSRQLAGHAPLTLRPMATSETHTPPPPPRDRETTDNDHEEAHIPARQPSKKQPSKRPSQNGIAQAYSSLHSPADRADGPALNGRSRFSITANHDNQDQDHTQQSAHYQSPPPSHHRLPETSTPPPIRNHRPDCLPVPDDFLDDNGDDGTTTEDSDGPGYGSRNHRAKSRNQPAAPANEHLHHHHHLLLLQDNSPKPLQAWRRTGSADKQPRLGSVSSDSIRSPRTTRARVPQGRATRGNPMSGVHGPHANGGGFPPYPISPNGGGGGGGLSPHAISTDGNGSTPQSRTMSLSTTLRDVRTPKLNALQMYQDAAPSRPLIDRAAEARQQREAKSYRSFDAGLSAGGMISPPPASVPASGRGSGGGGGGGGAVDWPPQGSLARRRAYSDEALSVRQMSMSGRSATSQQSVALPDFFSTGTFNVVLHNPTTAHQLLQFSETRLCAENVEFLSRVDEYRTTLNLLATQMAGIHKTFISPGSHSQINVNGNLLRQTHKDMKMLINEAFPAMETVFTDLQEHIETVVFQDIYPSFVRHQMALSATRALGSDRFKYQGLGDCFTLTDPNIADNPILFASDGFVKVTGYTRAEIIPRNCRFLQGAHTDREPVRRLKQAIESRKESVELLLNYKKNREPFWNLLYVAPLYDSKGNLRFFIGGQVNCSTTIHTNADVMKVLSLSKKDRWEENESLRAPSTIKQQQQQQQQPPMKPSARRALLKAFGVRLEDQTILPHEGDGGMEDGVLNRMEGQDLGSQMKEFYTAYSKYLVVRTKTWNIEFFSDGIAEALNPPNLAGPGLIAGCDVFRFLGQQMLTKQSEYKNRVRSAIRAGMPTSTLLRLLTKRSAVFRGDEPFLAHWTPLKDAKANVQWVVVTIAPTT